ncbi:hypothetical protein Y032_0055g2542 [Ancylostoma ceylanicum]|nr:hypothetical protein Y032_0055g2542 [Ancylostoma ceylanicum]
MVHHAPSSTCGHVMHMVHHANYALHVYETFFCLQVCSVRNVLRGVGHDEAKDLLVLTRAQFHYTFPCRFECEWARVDAKGREDTAPILPLPDPHPVLSVVPRKAVSAELCDWPFGEIDQSQSSAKSPPPGTTPHARTRFLSNIQTDSTIYQYKKCNELLSNALSKPNVGKTTNMLKPSRDGQLPLFKNNYSPP